MSVKELIEAKVDETINRVNDLFGIDIKRPPIKYNLRGAIAGMVCYEDTTKGICYLRFNLPIAESHTEDYLERTIPHEIAHIVSRMLYGNEGNGHGIYWKSVMHKMGLEPSRCHTYDLCNAKLTHKRVRATCGCDTPHYLTKKKASQISLYICRNCKQTLKLV